jgi:tetratricopeptide (TPR) repeat protein
MRTSTRRPIPAEAATTSAAIATRIGTRLKQARLAANWTQQQLAGDRYTKAYVSALENGLVRPSMAALEFFATRLGVTPSRLLGDDSPAWSRLEADVHLAAGRWQEAVDGYTQQLEAPTDARGRAELLCGRAEALARLNEPLAAATDAGEAERIFTAAGRLGDAALARYWLAFAQHLQGNAAEARSLLRGVLEQVRGGLSVEPDFHVRLLVALAATESRDGDHAKALAYLHEVKSIAGELDDRRRAAYYYDLAIAYRHTGDHEGAIRAGSQSLALYRSAGSDSEVAMLENDLALAHLASGHVARAKELVADSRDRFARLHDTRWLAHVDETAAQIALADGQPKRAIELARTAERAAIEVENAAARISAVLTIARSLGSLGETDAALEEFARAASLARAQGANTILREILGQWADVLAKSGLHEQAYALTREALAVS